MQLPVSVENEQAVCESMVAGCEAAMANYPTSLADDMRQQASMTAEDASPEALALRVRMVLTPPSTLHRIARVALTQVAPWRAAAFVLVRPQCCFRSWT